MSPWLSLGQAAAAIGVHPITLRRWADRGQIPSTRTVGGHRRFRETDVEACVRARQRIRRLGGLEGRWASEVQRSIRRGHPFDASPSMPVGPRDRVRFRRSGQRLLSLMVDVSGERMEAECARRQAQRLGRAYAAWAAHRKVPLAKMLRAFAPIRQALLGAAFDLVQAENIEPQAVRRLVSVMQELTQAVEIGLLEDAQPVTSPSAGTG